jgi:ABC-type multidrug transport system ATPase subunit
LPPIIYAYPADDLIAVYFYFKFYPISQFAITVDQLSKRFNREWIFKDLCFAFEGGGMYAVVGPNGSGKSTLMQILWGQMLPSSGSVAYSKNGVIIEMESAFKHVTIATPYMDLIDEFTLLEQLRFHFRLRKSRNGLSVDQLLREISMNNNKNKYIGNFSSGMKQRVKLALALFTETDVIFLDEPGTNLDEKAFSWYLRSLEQMAEGRLVFIASNQAKEYPSNAIKVDIMTLK